MEEISKQPPRMYKTQWKTWDIYYINCSTGEISEPSNSSTSKKRLVKLQVVSFYQGRGPKLLLRKRKIQKSDFGDLFDKNGISKVDLWQLKHFSKFSPKKTMGKRWSPLWRTRICFKNGLVKNHQLVGGKAWWFGGLGPSNRGTLK